MTTTVRSCFLLTVLAVAQPALAQFPRWDTGQTIPGTERIYLQFPLDLSKWNQADHNLQYADLAGVTLREARFRQNWMQHADFSGADLTDADFERTLLQSANFTGAQLRGTRLDRARLEGANFTDAHVAGAILTNTILFGFQPEQLYSTASYKAKDLRGTDFSANVLTGWTFKGMDLTEARFSAAILSDVDFTDAIIRGADFRNSHQLDWAQIQLTASYQQRDLSGIQFQEAELQGVDFQGINLSNAILSHRRGGSSFVDVNFRQANLSNVDLSGADITNAQFGDALIENANFTNAKGLTEAQFRSTRSFKDGNLGRITLIGNDLTDWDLSDQNLSGMDLSRNSLSATVLKNTDFSSSNLAGSLIADVDVEGAIFANAHFEGITLRSLSERGFVREQLYSSASYQAKELPSLKLESNDLSGWDFSGQRLANGSFRSSDLTDASLAGANLHRVDLQNATLLRTDFTDARLHLSTEPPDSFAGGLGFQSKSSGSASANFSGTTSRGFTAEQLYGTADYKEKNLRRLTLSNNDLTGWDFTEQDLFDADLSNSTLADANFTDANIEAAHLTIGTKDVPFGEPSRVVGLSAEQFYSTANYKTQQLESLKLGDSDLTGWQFQGQNLQYAKFHNSNLTDAKFDSSNLKWGNFQDANFTNTSFVDAQLKGADFSRPAGPEGSSLTAEQFYQSASYKAGDLATIRLGGLDLSGWDFQGQDLTGVAFVVRGDNFGASQTTAKMDGANFTNARVNGTGFTSAVANGFTRSQLYSTQSYQSKNLSRIQLDANDLSGWDFSEQDLSSASLQHTTLHGANFSGARLHNAMLLGADVLDAEFENASIKGAQLPSSFTYAQLASTANFRAGDLSQIRFAGDLSNWDFTGMDLSQSSLNSVWGSFGTVLAPLDVTGTIFKDAIVSHAFLNTMTAAGFSPQQLYATASYQAGDLSEIVLSQNDLSGWNFQGQDLAGADLQDATLLGTDFSAARLVGANLDRSVARGANFAGATLDNTVFRDANFSSADFSNAQLVNARFVGASLVNANLSEAQLAGVSLYGVDLTNANFSGAHMVGADLRASIGLAPDATADTRNVIGRDGRVAGLDVRSGETFYVRRVPNAAASIPHINVSIVDGFRVATGGTMEVDVNFALPELFRNADPRPLIIGEGTVVELGGTLVLDGELQVGQAATIFDWAVPLDEGNTFDTVRVPAGTRWNLDDLYTTGMVTMVEIGDWGDFNVSGKIDAFDMDLLSEAVRSGVDFTYDLNGDALLDDKDRRAWIEYAVSTTLGDANLDQMVGFADFLALSDAFGEPGGWANGDFDGDGEIAFGDFLLLTDHFGEQVAATSVPEPQATWLMLMFVFSLRRPSTNRPP